MTITLPDTNSGPVYALSGDLNGDGYSDIVVVNQNSGTVSILLADSTQPLINEYSVVGTYAVGTAPSSVLVRDLDGDGIADLAVANGDSGTISVLLGRGDGTFDPPVTFGVGNNPAVVVGSNFNGDRATDLAVANTGDNTVSILLFSGPLAYDFQWNVWEDTPTNVVLRGIDSERRATDLHHQQFADEWNIELGRHESDLHPRSGLCWQGWFHL